ncbi:hypothetical protein [Marinobacter sp. M-5]|uniref:hypothetical protein n=1 Tax=Marinobacter sp. M-5 TaxID=3081089 RepID=UPI00293D0730|nr:hypothetical protein [Marinobacter sp. M-5]MDV3502748.1 hypothetical protein [Marinobacter sp. M-5]
MKLLKITAAGLLVALLSSTSYADDSENRSVEVFKQVLDDGKVDHVQYDLNELEARIENSQRERMREKARKANEEGQGEGSVSSENADLEGASSGD